MRFRILGRLVSFMVSSLSLAVVIAIAWLTFSNNLHAAEPSEPPLPISSIQAMKVSPMPWRPGQGTIENSQPQRTPRPPVTTTATASATASPSATPTATPSPSPTATLSPTPTITLAWQSGYVEQCQPMIYAGIEHCIKGPYQIVRVDPKHPQVRFEVVLPMGYDRYGNYGECRDVNVPDTIIPGKSNGPGCYYGTSYPGERIGHMADRYPGAIVAFNGDFFSPTYAHGAMGLTVKNGVRLDGIYNDRDGLEVRRSSISISRDGNVRIGIVPRSSLPNPEEPWTWIPDPEQYYNTIGGLPLLVKEGLPVDLHERCMLEQGWCPDPDSNRARTAIGLSADGWVVIVVIPEARGLKLEKLSYLMVEIGCIAAINVDGGGSSQLWYDGDYLLYSSRPVAQGVLVFSTLMDEMGDEMGSQTDDGNIDSTGEAYAPPGP